MWPGNIAMWNQYTDSKGVQFALVNFKTKHTQEKNISLKGHNFTLLLGHRSTQNSQIIYIDLPGNMNLCFAYKLGCVLEPI